MYSWIGLPWRHDGGHQNWVGACGPFSVRAEPNLPEQNVPTTLSCPEGRLAVDPGSIENPPHADGGRPVKRPTEPVAESLRAPRHRWVAPARPDRATARSS